MKRGMGKRLAGLAGSLLFASGAWAQTATPLSLASLTRNAAMIFGGEVTRVERVPPAQTSGEPMMQITFRVSQAIRGTRPGQTVVLREWEGLWQHRGEHYRVGEHLVLFLHRSSREGLSSPIGGRSGRFEIDRQNNLVLRPEQLEMIINTLPARATRVKPMASGLSKQATVPTVPYREFIRILRQAAEGP